MLLKDKNIILGITGSIAAYKAAILVRQFVINGANVKVIMTPYAKEFITPVTLATLSKNTVLCDFFHHDDGAWNSHVDLGIWADLMLIAPASANTIAKMANGIADNLLLTTYLSARCPVMVAPAMDMDMFSHKATQKNIQIIKEYGNLIIEPSSGELASGLIGKGRMEEPEVIVKTVVDFFDSKKKLNNKKFLVTAGPTHEQIDPVRYIGNNSTGKMGYAIAEKLADYGAEVILISGPTSLKTNSGKIEKINVINAQQMYNECINKINNVDGVIMAAAVADYTTKNYSENKIKKSDNDLQIKLKKTVDIAKEIGKQKKENQVFIGFALETENEKDNAINKIKTKNFDFIVLNSLNDNGAGFGYDTNKITIIDKYNNITDFELKTKNLVAKDIIDKCILGL